MHRALIPIVPAMDRLRFQAVHSLDVGEAYRRAVVGDARGAFNIAAEPVLDPQELGRLLGARPVPVSPRVLRGVVTASWKLRLQPSPPGWLDMALGVPLMDVSRAQRELGWSATRTRARRCSSCSRACAAATASETPPLEPGGDGPLRVRELLTGVGARSR